MEKRKTDLVKKGSMLICLKGIKKHVWIINTRIGCPSLLASLPPGKGFLGESADLSWVVFQETNKNEFIYLGEK